jgi:hypothetical protein
MKAASSVSSIEAESVDDRSGGSMHLAVAGTNAVRVRHVRNARSEEAERDLLAKAVGIETQVVEETGAGLIAETLESAANQEKRLSRCRKSI